MVSRAAKLLGCGLYRAAHPRGGKKFASDACSRLASEVLRDVRTLDRKIADVNGRIEAEVEASSTLTEIFGIGPILAARIVGSVGEVGRFPTKAHFASHSGISPLEAPSGEVVHHRLSLAGNRKLNYTLHMVAVCQARSDARGAAYYRKKMAEGKSPTRRRCGASRGASRMPSSGVLWRTCRRPAAAQPDKEEPRSERGKRQYGHCDCGP